MALNTGYFVEEDPQTGDLDGRRPRLRLPADRGGASNHPIGFGPSRRPTSASSCG
jgi:hypothetical protein